MAAPSGNMRPAREFGQDDQSELGRPLIVALEGPPLAGKSTLASRLARLEPSTQVFSDYYDGIPVDRQPGFDPGSTEAQVLAIREFLDVELKRLLTFRQSPPRICILDRSIESLRAHADALDADRGYASRAALESELMTREHLEPDIVLYLDTPRQVLEQRLDTRANFHDLLPYLESGYLSHIERHFRRLACERSGVHLLPFETYVDRVSTAVSSLLPVRGVWN